MPTQQPTAAWKTRFAGRPLSLWSLLMLVVFVIWTVVYIFVSGLTFATDESPFGDTMQGVEWLGWVGLTTAWVWPLVVGIVLGILGARKGEGNLAIAGSILNAVLLLFLVVPSLLGWLVG